MATGSVQHGEYSTHRLLAGRDIWTTGAWYLAAMLGCLSVLLINGAPLYYFDTGGYLAQGEQFLKLVGLAQDDVVGAGGAGGGTEPADDNTIQGNRSLIYGIVLGLFQAFANLSVAVIAQSAILIFTVWLCVRATLRAYRGSLSNAAATGVAVLAACLASAPFYTAFLMPDIFASVLILSLSALSVLMGLLRVWEILVFFLLAAASVVMHPSHLLMALLFVPVAPIAAYLSGRRRVVLSLLLVGSVALVGVAERFAFTFAAEEIADSEVVYQPFLTARLIVDGPALDYLEEVCPEAELATCDLIEKFVRPYQVTASHIVFETSEELGSFKLLPEDTQRRIVQEQKMLLFEVIRTRPFSLVRAVGMNMLAQASRVSVLMTLPDEEILANVELSAPEAAKIFSTARLTDWAAWIPKLTLFHYVLYGVSGAIILISTFWRSQSIGCEFRTFVWVALYGVAANSLVLGALSQPADRYGARVSFLLPVLAAIIFLRWRCNRPDQIKGGRTE